MSIVQRLFGAETAPAIDEADEIDPLEDGIDELFHLLANPRRRYVIDVVGDLDDGEMMTVDELANGLAFVENDGIDHIREASGPPRKRCYVSLYQTHLSQMDEAGAIVYDKPNRSVAPTVATSRLQEVVRVGYREASKVGWSA